MSESSVVQVVGDTTFEWTEATPLVFRSISRDKGVTYTDDFDLSALSCFDSALLLGIKDLIVARSLKLKRGSLNVEFARVMRLLKKIQAAQTADESHHLMSGPISQIDEALMLGLRERLASDPNWIHRSSIQTLRSWFEQFGNGSVFHGLKRAAFPVSRDLDGTDRLRQRIIKQAFSRTMQVAVLIEVERLMTAGELPSPVWVMWNLVNCTYLRPESLRTLRCKDLEVPGKSGGAYTLWVRAAKGPKNRSQERIPYKLHAELGQILQVHIRWVLETLGPAFGLSPDLDETTAEKNKGRLALFPRFAGAPRDDELANSGVVTASYRWSQIYLRPIQKAVDVGCSKLHFNAMRHTIGTQLAASGVAAAIIQAVLRHADDKTAKTYVDLAAQELREALNAGLKELGTFFPAFRAFTDSAEMRRLNQTEPRRLVRLGAVGGAIGGNEEIGECGGKGACQYAPLSCYGCGQWIANADADHSIPLDYVRNRIKRNRALGHIATQEVERDTLLEKLIELRISQIELHKSARDSVDLMGSKP
ncbi:site-specific integrase [Niveibacterium sp.]|uniref:site-specific integrase n=1 Tax=Niveibacterium sp. TaxID=2017444 RepID=UPI0035AF7295